MQKPNNTILCLALAASCTCGVAGAQSLSQNISITSTWDIEVSIDAAKAKKNPSTAKALEGTLGLVGGAVKVATMTDRLTFNNGSYSVSSLAQANALISMLLPNSAATRTSRGRSDGGSYMTSVEFTEERTKGHVRRVVLDYGKKISSYFKTGKQTKQETLPYRTADIASLPYVFYKKPLPTGTVTIAATDGMSTRIFKLTPAPDNVNMGSQSIQAVKLTHQPTGPNDAGLTLWVRKSDGFPLRVRLDMNAKYGAIMDQKLKGIPAGI